MTSLGIPIVNLQKQGFHYKSPMSFKPPMGQTAEIRVVIKLFEQDQPAWEFTKAQQDVHGTSTIQTNTSKNKNIYNKLY